MTKKSETEKKLTDDNNYRCITTPEYNTLATRVLMKD